VGTGILNVNVSTTIDFQSLRYSQTMQTTESNQWLKTVEE
jgi:hypothetical protein